MKNKELWSTVVGSHMWGQQKPTSDMDIFSCFIAPSKDILVGKQFKSIVTNVKGDVLDMSEHELGKVVTMLQSGNVNFIWGVMSPQIVTDGAYRRDLVKLYKREISKNCFHSIKGLAAHNMRDAIAKYKTPDKIPQKKLNIVYRTVKFGIHILETGTVDFEGYVANDAEDIEQAVKELETAFENSSLPEQPNGEKYTNFLCKLRILELGGML